MYARRLARWFLEKNIEELIITKQSDKSVTEETVILSILVPVKNGIEYISSKIESLLEISRQDPGIEILFSINVSDDGTREWISDRLSLLPHRFQFWFQPILISGQQQMEFLVSKARGEWLVFTAIDDELTIKDIPLFMSMLTISTNQLCFMPTWSYFPETHGNESIKIDLFCDLELRLQNLIEKLRVSHGVFYSVCKRELWIDYLSVYGLDFIGSDWLFDIFITIQSPVRNIPSFEIVFHVNGLSRQPNAFYLQDQSILSRVFPYWKLSKKLLHIGKRVDSQHGRRTLKNLSGRLLMANVHRLFFGTISRIRKAKVHLRKI